MADTGPDSKGLEAVSSRGVRIRSTGGGPAGDTFFLPYQSAWIRDDSHLKICEKGRQIGLSYADSYDSVRKAAQKKAIDVWVMSRDEVQAKQYILYCKRWANVLKHAAQDLGEQVFTLDSGKQVCVQVLKFASGASVYALSSNPDAIVGKTGHVKLDEFALHKDQRGLYAVAKPVIQWGGTLSIISTHRGVATVFHELIGDIRERGNKMGWSLHTIPIQRAVEDGIVEKIDQAAGGKLREQYLAAAGGGPNGTGGTERTEGLGHATLREWWLGKQRAECIDEEQWLQEYCCVPADESTAFLTYDLITGCEDAGLRLDGTNGTQGTDAALYLGVDVARKTDLCVFDLGEKVGDVMWDRARIELQHRSFSEIQDTLYQLVRLPGLRRACIDATGLGMQLAEQARERFGWKVEPVTFTGPVKEELAFGLRAAFEDRRLRIVRDDKLRADLRGIKKSVTAAGHIRFEGEAADSHCDRFWAKALRQHAVGKPAAFWSEVV